MEIKATAKYLRLSSTKTRRVIDLVRGKPVKDALDILQFSNQKPAHYIIKVLNSAIANAKHNHDMKEEELMIKKITADKGPVLKRWRPRAFGRANLIRKPLTHIRLVLEGPDKKTKKSTAKKDTSDIVPATAEKEMAKQKLIKKQKAKPVGTGKRGLTGGKRIKFQRRTGDK